MTKTRAQLVASGAIKPAGPKASNVADPQAVKARKHEALYLTPTDKALRTLAQALYR